MNTDLRPEDVAALDAMLAKYDLKLESTGWSSVEYFIVTLRTTLDCRDATLHIARKGNDCFATAWYQDGKLSQVFGRVAVDEGDVPLFVWIEGIVRGVTQTPEWRTVRASARVPSARLQGRQGVEDDLAPFAYELQALLDRYHLAFDGLVFVGRDKP